MKRLLVASNMSDEPAVKKIPLTLTEKYASSWGTWEGVREVVQNWHDGLYETRINADIRDDSREVEMVYEKQNHNEMYRFDIYEAYARYFHPRTDTTEERTEHSKRVLGYIIYEKKDYGRLYLINKDISLQKKILLLGYSKKAEVSEVIGQFGEGLKVGALALVRDGRIVTMETGTDFWRFEFNDDPVFEERVLTVHVTPRGDVRDETESCAVCNIPDHIKLQSADTLITVTLEKEKWEEYGRRFLFLIPPTNVVNTELGQMMLDKELAGQLYVRKVWVADMRKEDLATGVNFVNLRIDRDRNAVPKPSEIDHLIGSMWQRALELRPDLSNTFYKLLQNSHLRDVRQAIVYADQSMATLVADEFEKEHGNKMPVSNTLASTELEMIRTKLDVQLVLVNETMLKLLHMSGKHRPVEEELKALEKQPFELVPSNKVTDEERGVVKHALQLMQLAHPDINIGDLDVIEYTSPTSQGCSKIQNRIQIPRWMLAPDRAHAPDTKCPTDICKCREVRLMYSLCNALIESNLGGPKQYEHHLLDIIRPLAAQACSEAQEYCRSLHTPGAEADVSVSHDTCQMTEQSLRRDMEEAKVKYVEEISRFRDNIDALKAEVRESEKSRVNNEVESTNTEQKLREDFAIKFNLSQEMWKEKVEKYNKKAQEREKYAINAQQEKEIWHGKFTELQGEYKRAQEAIDRKKIVMLEELLHYVHQCQSRTQTFQKWCEQELNSEKLDKGSKEQLECLQKIVKILTEELQKDRFMCTICFLQRKDTIFIPCGHYRACERCVGKLSKKSDGVLNCHECKQRVEKTQKVFG